MTGATLKHLLESSSIGTAELARELGITIPSVKDAFESQRLRVSTEERYLLAIGRLIRAKAAERERFRIEAALAGLPA